MKPGRELDALVAEKVMGIEGIVWESGEPVEHSACPWDDEVAITIIHIKEYSTDIAAACEVVEKLGTRRMGYSLNLTNVAGTTSKPSWDADFFKLQQSNSNESEAMTAPHAICLAALKAVGYEPS